LINAEAIEPVEGLVIPSKRLRDLMVEDVSLGERIMRALILRRVRLLESGVSGPIIIGRADGPTSCSCKSSWLATGCHIACSMPIMILVR